MQNEFKKTMIAVAVAAALGGCQITEVSDKVGEFHSNLKATAAEKVAEYCAVPEVQRFAFRHLVHELIVPGIEINCDALDDSQLSG